MPIANLWAGRFYGTNTGNVAVSLFACPDGTYEGSLVFNDDRGGLSRFDLEVAWDGTIFNFVGEPSLEPEDVQLPSIALVGSLNSKGEIEGTWWSAPE